MSHLTKIKSRITNIVLLKQSLDALKIKYIEQTGDARLTVRGWNNTSEKAVMLLKTGGPYDVGLVFNEKEGVYEFVADWWGVETYTEKTQQQYIDTITQRYSYESVMEKIALKGYSVVNEEVDEKNTIRIVLRKWE